MTATESVIGKNYAVQDELDSAPGSLAGFLVGTLYDWGRDLLGEMFPQADEDLISPEQEQEGFRYVGNYKGRPVYTASNDRIRDLLVRYGATGDEAGDLNYGAALDGNIYINDMLLEGAADGGRTDPLSGMEIGEVLKYVLEHEWAHTQGADEVEADEYAYRATGFRF